MSIIKEIEDFVRKNLESGKSEEVIKTDLASVGWNEIDITDTITAVKKSDPKTEGEKSLNYEIRTPVNQPRFSHLKETIEQYESPKDKRPKKLGANLPKKSYLPLILIPIVVTMGVGARIYLKNTYPEAFGPKTAPPNLDQEILNNLNATTTNSNSSSDPNSSTTQTNPGKKPPPIPEPKSTSTPNAPGRGGID